MAYISPEIADYQRSEALLVESAADLYEAGDLWAVNVALQSRAEVALAAGEFQRATALYEESLELAIRQSDTRGRAQALVGHGFVELVAGELPAAVDLLKQGLELSTQVSNPELVAYALRGLAGVASAHHDFVRAARLLGAAQALSDTAGTVDWPVRRRLYRRFEQEVRDGLGVAGYADAYAAGRALSLAEAAGFAKAGGSAALDKPAVATMGTMSSPDLAAGFGRRSSTPQAAGVGQVGNTLDRPAGELAQVGGMAP